MPVDMFEYLLAYIIYHCRILSDLLIVYQISIRKWTLSPQPTHHIQPLCPARPCAFCAKVYLSGFSLSFLPFTQPPQIPRSIPGATSMTSPNLITPAYVVPYLQAPHVPHSLSLPSQVLHILWGSVLVTPTDSPLYKLSPTPRSTSKLQARITMPSLHANPVPCVHLNFFHLNYIRPLGPMEPTHSVLLPKLLVHFRHRTGNAHVTRLHYKNAINMKDQGSILNFIKKVWI